MIYVNSFFKMLCPYCKKHLADEIPITRFGDILSYDEMIARRLRRGHIATVPVKPRVYDCPRCTGRFITKEIIHYQRKDFKPNKKAIKLFEDRKRKGLGPPKEEVKPEIKELITKVFGEDIEKDCGVKPKDIWKK